ncbi:ACP S-malonyltransferase [Catellatospora paridis]|uniref:ACP S-malonyltransferase n=1 Tax=Catellatospora paridis TaxID=1617086 RepID=UPI0012D41316|nr:acyltransferase domain-containing protein [Catellatospora paridis]
MSTALLFPGQGSQRPGMLTDLPDTPAGRQTLQQAREVLATLDGVPEPVDDAAALQATTNAQLALLIAGVVTARALIDDHGLRVAAVAGHSVGAFAAAVTAGVLGLDDALRAVAVRGREMERACAGEDWGMAALTGLGESAARALVDAVATRDAPLWLANLNAADQVVVSGTRQALDRLAVQAPAAGARDLRLLAVSVASHCPLQATTAQAVARALTRVTPGTQRCVYFADTTGRQLAAAPALVLDDLAAAVAQPVRWYDIIRLMPEVGVTATVEVPPGHVLSAINARQNPAMTTVAVDEVGIAAALRRIDRASMT